MGMRLAALHAWLTQLARQGDLALTVPWHLQPICGDASFRRYFRLTNGPQSWIAVDAPPDKESCLTFVTLAKGWRLMGVPVPEVFHLDALQGFMLLEDFGDQDLLSQLQQGAPDPLYQQALDTLRVIQRCPAAGLPVYDEVLLRAEMHLFIEWFLGQLLQQEIANWQPHLDRLMTTLVANALQQPTVTVHRDYHSRNLMVCTGHLGVIDFQDAVQGPLTYDLVSLLRDCYITWPATQVAAWRAGFYQQLVAAGQLDEGVSLAQFARWFDLMGMQRHLKAIGIFARLHLRDNKSRYLQDIPRTLDYLLTVAQAYPEFATFAALLEQQVVPVLSRPQWWQRAS